MKLWQISIILLLILLPFVSIGQQLYSLSGGINLPQVMRNSSSPYLSVGADFNTSYAISFDYVKYTGKHFGLGTSLDYVNTTADLTITTGSHIGTSHTDSAFYRFGFLNISILPGFKWGEKVQFFVQAGAYFGFLTNTNSDARENIQHTDMGLAGVLGLRVPVSKQMGLMVKNSYSYGFGKKYKDADDLTTLNIMILGGIYYSLPGN
jgi:hypothetical protein